MTHPGVGHVTALATEVFLGDPSRFVDGKALASYVGMIPREYSSGNRQRLGGLSKQGNPLLRFLCCEAALHAVRRDPTVARFYRRKLQQRAWPRLESPPLGSWGFACGLCCAIGSITRSSAAEPSAAGMNGGARAGMLVWAMVLFVSGRQTDYATRLPQVEGVRTSHHGPPGPKRCLVGNTVRLL